jgi:hypothetical protein
MKQLPEERKGLSVRWKEAEWSRLTRLSIEIRK